MRKIDIGEIEGFRLGNAENAEAGTGVTVIIAEDGAVGGVDVRGGGPATRETDLLKSENTVDKIHAVVLSGGSAFGLEAGSGVMRALAEKGIGFKIDENIVVPIVPGASLYDLTIGRSDVFPDVEMGREAVRNAYEGTFESGNHGAGTGATVGKYLGYGRAMKTGIGTFACGDDYVQVGAIAAVNAVGDIYNGAGNIIAGLRTTDGKAIKGTIRVLKGLVHDESAPDLDLTDIKSIAASEALNRTASQGFSNKLSEDKAESQTEDKTGDDKDDIVAAMMRSYEQENSPQPEPSPEPAIAESTAEAAEPVLEPEPAPEPAQESVSEPASVAETVQVSEIADEYLNIQDSDVQYTYTEEPAAVEVPAPQEAESVISEVSEPVTEDLTSADIVPEYTYTEEPAPVEVQSSEPEVQTATEIHEEIPSEPAAEPEPVTDQEEQKEPEDDDDGYILTEEDKADLGYDIPFNTTISCVTTNAVLTKNQANKLAQILHDAYARAVKPVHGTLDGDTIFVMSTCKVKVNFDAFAALATDVLQYAVIDGAASAESAYGLPAARDMIHK